MVVELVINQGNIVLGSDLLNKANLPTDLSNLNKLKFSAAMPFPYKTGAAYETIKEKVEKSRKTI